MKVRAIKTYPQLQHIFKEGDIVTIEPILYDKDTVIVNEWWSRDNNYVKKEKLADEVIAKKGTFKGYTLIAENGKEIVDTSIVNMIGNKPLEEMFIKIN